jgi:AraC-like DNA-binding protein
LAWHAVKYAALALVGLGIWQTLAGRRGDLVEGRRRLRLVLAIAAACYIVAIEFIAFATLGQGGGSATTIALDVAIGIYAAVAIFARLTHVSIVATAAEPVVVAPRRQATSADPEETRLLEALRQAMEIDRAYREEGCSIAALASRLGIPEYRLRRLINQRLGHRNFASYVNGYRLAETTAALADPSQERVPILTIALDAGFQSLGPFNRAFKAHTGRTPSEFRRERLAAAAPVAVGAPPATAPPADFGNRPAIAKIG